MKSIATLSMLAFVWVAIAGAAEKAETKADEKPTSRPAITGQFRNETCPMTGKPTTTKDFISYLDKEKDISARIYTCGPECVKDAEGTDIKALYEQTFLTKADGSKLKYGENALKLNNMKCPVTGEEADGSVQVSYNGVAVTMCCPGCGEEFSKNPDKYLHNVQSWIDKATAK